MSEDNPRRRKYDDQEESPSDAEILEPRPGDPRSAYDLPEDGPGIIRTGTRRRRPPQRPDLRPDPRPERRPPPPPELPVRRGYGCADVITALFLLLTVGVVAFTILLLANPRSVLNPLPPPTLPALLVIATPEPTLTPTFTFTPEPPTPTIPTATPTETPTPTHTPTPTLTYTPVVGGFLTETAQAGPATLAPIDIPTLTPAFTRSPFQFTVKSIRYQSHQGPEACQWMSIAGIVLNLAGAPRAKAEGTLTVRITAADGSIDEFHFVGDAPEFGESGFEAYVGPIPRAADFTLQLLGVTGAPASDKVAVQTRAGCDENVVVVEFQQNQ